MEAEWSVWIHDLQTGARIRPLQLSGDASWSTSIDGSGQSFATVVVNDAEYPFEPTEIADLFAPNKRMLVRWWGENGGGDPGDSVVCAHKVDSWDYDRDAGTVSVSAVDVLTEAKWRMVDWVGADKHSTLTITNRSAAGAVAEAIGRMIGFGWEWSLPIDLPLNTAGDFSGSWVFWKGFFIADIIDEIRERTGCDVFLAPYATSTGGVRFRTLVGSPIATGDALFSLDAKQSPVAAVKYRVDGSQQLTGLLGIGNGTGEEQETRWSGGIRLIPIRDTKKSFNDLAGDALQQAVDQHYASMVNPVVQWDVGSFTVSDDSPPTLVLPGRGLRLEVHGDPVIPDGVHGLRVVTASGGNGREIKPGVQYV